MTAQKMHHPAPAYNGTEVRDNSINGEGNE